MFRLQLFQFNVVEMKIDEHGVKHLDCSVLKNKKVENRLKELLDMQADNYKQFKTCRMSLMKFP